MNPPRTNIHILALFIALVAPGYLVQANDGDDAYGSVGQAIVMASFRLQQKPADKILAVGKEGIKLKGKLTDEAKNVPYSIRMEEGKTYQIRLNSKDFDAYLFVKDDKGKQLDYDDDSGGGTNSLLEFRAPANGVFVILATSLGMGGTGEYEISVTKKP